MRRRIGLRVARTRGQPTQLHPVQRQKLRIVIAAAQPFEKRRQVTLVAPMIAIDHDIGKTGRRHLRRNRLRRPEIGEVTRQRLRKSNVPEANGNAELSPWTQPISADLARAWRSTPSDPSNPRADEFATEEDDNGAATWRRIADAVEQLANTAPSGP